MAVYSFSTSTKPGDKDDKIVLAAKEYCAKHKIVFSRVVIEQLAKWLEEQNNAR